MDATTLKKRAKFLRTHQTDSEKKLWYYIRAKRFNTVKFYRQFVISPYIVDFVCRDLRLIIEIDGGQHMADFEKDKRRTLYFEKRGYRVIRFWNNQILNEIEGVLETLSLALSQRERELKS